MSTRTERYEVIETVQEGQLAASYKARDRVLDRLVLLKVLHPSQARDHDLVQRFRREALLQARLKHPNIVTVYDFGSEDDFYIASEYVEGVALDRLLSEKGRLTPAELAPIVRDVCRALVYAHEQGVVHRDLKPANIMIAGDGRAKLTDFGLAFCRDLGQLTQEGCIVGTPAYMSPEQSRGRRTDARTDVFSLGIVIYEALSGTNPFAAASFADSMSLVLGTEPKPLSEIVPGVPAGLSRVVAKMLAKDPAARPQDLAGLSSTLDASSFTPDSPPRSSLSSVLVPSLILLAVAVAAAAFLDLGPVRPQTAGYVLRPLDRDSLVQDTAGPEQGAGLVVPEAESTKPAEPVKGPAGPVSAPRFCVTKIAVSPWAEVTVDDMPVGTTPISRPLKLAVGRHVIRLANPYYPALTRVVELSDSVCTLTFDLEAEFAFLDVRVSPWAVVSLDGRLVDTTPLDRPIPVEPGRHELTLTHPELGTMTRSVSADTAGHYRLVFDFGDVK